MNVPHPTAKHQHSIFIKFMLTASYRISYILFSASYIPCFTSYMKCLTSYILQSVITVVFGLFHLHHTSYILLHTSCLISLFPASYVLHSPSKRYSISSTLRPVSYIFKFDEESCELQATSCCLHISSCALYYKLKDLHLLSYVLHLHAFSIHRMSTVFEA